MFQFALLHFRLMIALICHRQLLLWIPEFRSNYQRQTPQRRRVARLVPPPADAPLRRRWSGAAVPTNAVCADDSCVVGRKGHCIRQNSQYKFGPPFSLSRLFPFEIADRRVRAMQFRPFTRKFRRGPV